MTDEPRPRAFTDAELAAILEAPPTESTAALARRLGRHRSAVGNARRGLRGGACPVTWESCVVCGSPVPLRPGGAQPLHLRCRRAYRRAYLAARYGANPAAQRAASQRWKERDPGMFAVRLRAAAQRRKARHPEAFAAQLDRLDEYKLAEQERTAAVARRVKVPWTAEEDAFVLATIESRLTDVAIERGRTWYATSKRRTLLRRRTGDADR